MTNPAGEITLVKSYEPYGRVSQSAGDSQTAYGFTGEWTDSTGNVYLRARYYNPTDGRFMSRDTWSGDVNHPLSLNKWMYVEGNPVNFTDPTGHITQADDLTAQVIAADLRIRYNVEIVKDWGYRSTSLPQILIKEWRCKQSGKLHG
jgi:RHS repeat-associated protein